MTPTKRAGLKRRAARYEYWRNDPLGGPSIGWWYFHLRAANGEIVCQSEEYTTKASVLRAIASHRRAAATETIRERK